LIENTKYPFIPSWIMSVDPSQAVVITGVPDIIASTCTNPNDSFLDGAMSTSAVA